MFICYRFHANHITCLVSDLVTLHTFTTTFLYCELFQLCSLSKSFFRNDQQGVTLFIKLHSDDFILISKIHTTHTHSCTTHNSYICFFKSDTHTKFSHQEDFRIFGSCFHLNQFIIVPKTNGDHAFLSHI